MTITIFHKKAGGGPKFVHNIIGANPLNYHYTILSCNQFFKNQSLMISGNNSIIYLDKVFARFKKFIISPTSFLHLLSSKINIVHINEYPNFIGDIALFYGIIMRYPIILTPHGTLIEKKTKSVTRDAFRHVHDLLLKPLYTRFIDLWISTSKYEKKSIQNFLNNSKNARILPITLGVEKTGSSSDADRIIFIKKYGLEGKFIVSYIGRLNERKGIDFLLQAISSTKNEIKNLILLIVGPDDGYLGEINRKISILKIEDYVKILGFLEHKSGVNAAYGCSNVLAFPSNFENFGLVFVEAAINKVPIITSAKFTDIFDKNDVFFFHYGDVNKMIEHIKFIWQFPEVAKEKALKYYNKIMKMESWLQIKAKYERIYTKLISQSNFKCN